MGRPSREHVNNIPPNPGVWWASSGVHRQQCHTHSLPQQNPGIILQKRFHTAKASQGTCAHLTYRLWSWRDLTWACFQVCCPTGSPAAMTTIMIAEHGAHVQRPRTRRMYKEITQSDTHLPLAHILGNPNTYTSHVTPASELVHFHQPLSSAGIVMHKDTSKLSGMICQLCSKARHALCIILLHVHLPARPGQEFL